MASVVLLISGVFVMGESGMPIRTMDDLAKAKEELRKHYEPFLRSLPEKVDVRTRQDLSSDKWLSRHETGGGAKQPAAGPESYTVDLDDSGWTKTTVPEWRYAYVRRGAMSHILWYRTKFKAAPVKAGKRVFLVFGGVDWRAEVWLNGKKVGTHSVFHEPFRFDVTDVLQKENTLAVRVLDGPKYGEPSAIWTLFTTPSMPGPGGRKAVKRGVVLRDKARSHKGYLKGESNMGNGYGIHREVYLETVGTACVMETYTRGRLKKGLSTVRTQINSSEALPLTVEIDVLPENFKGKPYRHVLKHQTPKGVSEIAVNIPMPGAKLWSPDEPNMYRCRVTLKHKRKVIDVHDVLFGYRSFSIVSEDNPREGYKAGRFLLNGKPVVLHGTNIQGINVLWYWGETSKIVDVMLMLKAANYDSVRSVQKVQYPEVREIQDRLGIMSEQDLGCSHPRPELLDELEAAAGALARHSYNNPGVVLHSYANETHLEPERLLNATLKEDPDRIVVPVSGHPWQIIGNPAKGKAGYPKMPEELWANVVDDVHTYQGWYKNGHIPYSWVIPYNEDDRLITVGEFGAEGIDGYETMLTYPEYWGKTPEKNAQTIWGHVQTRAGDARQLIGGRGKMPKTLAENIEASQKVQADMTGSIAKGLRMSRRVGGYFQFHFIDVIPAAWPKSIVSHDLRPKKAYFAMAQLNQATVVLPHIPHKAEVMELWIDNDTDTQFKEAVMEWNIEHGGKVILAGRQEVDIPTWNPVKAGEIDVSGKLADKDVVTVETKLFDSNGRLLSTYRQEFFVKGLRG